MLKRVLKKVSTIGLCIAISTSFLAGCSTTKTTSKDNKKEITLCESWNFDSGFFTLIYPNLTSNFALYNYLPNFYETLVNNEDGKIVPGLAESWDISEDGLEYTFYLKKDIKFSDGNLFNAEAVKVNLDNIPKLLGDYNGAYGITTTLFNKIEVVDDYTVKVKLNSPYYGVLHDFTISNSLSIMSPAAYNADGTLSDKVKNVTLGTGPYMYDGQKNGETYTFVRNPNYNREKPEVDVFHVKVIPDNDAKLLALRSGEIDMIVGSSNLTYDAYNELKGDKNYKPVAADQNDLTRLIGFNVDQAPFNDRAVRLAVNHAVDKERISKDIFYGIEPPADKVLDPSLPYCNVKLKPYDYNVEEAIKILENSGWVDSDGDGIREKDGIQLKGELLYSSSVANLHDLAAALTSSLGKIGMEMKATGLEQNIIYQKIANGGYQAALQDTYGIPYDPYLFVSNFCTTPLRDNLTAQALKHVGNGNELVMGLMFMINQDEIQKNYNRILTEVQNGAAFVPLTSRKQLAVYNANTISKYDFYGQPVLINVASITLK
jgi:nickel transport system substrate-binding protein